jgi:cytochrome oxidase Cu insertion factor (SCO1/SenC/PrrC family)
MSRRALQLMTFLCVLALALPALTYGARRGKAYKIGDRVANFTFKDASGKSVSLNQFKDKIVVLNFFATW